MSARALEIDKILIENGKKITNSSIAIAPELKITLRCDSDTE